MYHFSKAICALLAVVVLLGAFSVLTQLPIPDTDILERMEASWSGVLRIWVCEGWQCGAGSLSAWLNAVSTQFEKRHKGVYVQFSSVSASTLASFNYAAENPPDMLIFAPAMLDTADDLLVLPDFSGLRAEFCGYGEGYVCPLAMGGYAWVANRRLEADPSLFLLPKDTAHLSYSAALPALLTREIASEGQASSPRDGVDLGLPAPTEVTTEIPSAQRISILPARGCARVDDAYARFTRGEAPLIAVTQREIRRLQLLDDSGRAPDWEILPADATFTDQIALAAVVDIYRSDLSERQKLCVELIDLFLSDAQQKALTSVRAFRVTQGSALYAGQRGMAQLEASLLRCKLELPPPFGSDWREAARATADSLLAGAEKGANGP